MEYYSAIIRNEVLTYYNVENFENVMLSARSQAQQAVWFHLCEMSRMGKSIRQKVVTRGWGRGRVTADGRVFWREGLMKISCNEVVVMFIQPCEYAKNH